MLPQEYINLYDKFADDIFQYCYLKVSDRAQAKEILQHTFMRTWEFAQQFTTEDFPKIFYRTADELIDRHRLVTAMKPILNPGLKIKPRTKAKKLL